MAECKILHLDIETSPKTAYVWRMFKENVSIDQLLQETYVLCWCAKWEGSNKMMSDALWNYKKHKRHPEDDSSVVRSIWKLLDEADVVVAHNGDRFDMPVLNSRFVVHGMQPPDPYKTVDTLKIARRKFRFDSNRLDALGIFLGVGRKQDTGGFKLWKDVLAGSEAAMKAMLTYNAQDVNLLEKVYKKLRAWDSGIHPLSTFSTSERPTCNACGSAKVHKKGLHIAQTRIYQRWKCADCGHPMRSTTSDKKLNVGTVLRSV